MLRILAGLLLATSGGLAVAQDVVFRDLFEDLTIPPDSCDGVEALTGLATQAQPGSWSTLFPGFVFPAPIGNFKWLTVQNGYAVSLPIAVASSFSASAGTVELAEASGMPTAPLVVTISKCRGDFRMAALVNAERNCMSFGTSAPIVLWLRNGAASPDYCPMQADTTYWLNIAYINVPITSPASSSCPGFGSCTSIVGARTFSQAEFQALLDAVRD